MSILIQNCQDKKYAVLRNVENDVIVLEKQEQLKQSVFTSGSVECFSTHLQQMTSVPFVNMSFARAKHTQQSKRNVDTTSTLAVGINTSIILYKREKISCRVYFHSKYRRLQIAGPGLYLSIARCAVNPTGHMK